MAPTQSEIGTHILEKANQIRSLLADLSTAEIIWRCFTIFQMEPHDALKKYGLKSPYRESMYLLGLALTTNEPVAQRYASDAEWKAVLTLVSEITSTYLSLFLEPGAESARVTEEGRERQAVAGMAFFHYFNTGVLVTSEQLIARSRATHAPFDADLDRLVGLSASDAIDMIQWIVAKVQQQLDEWLAAATTAKSAFASAAQRNQTRPGTNPGSAAEDGGPSEFAQTGEACSLARLELDPLAIARADVEKSFGEHRTRAFWSLFVSRREAGGEFRYFSEANPAQWAPLIASGEDVAMLPVANALFHALAVRFDEILRNSDRSAAFLRNRDIALERRVEKIFRELFVEAIVLSSVSEHPSGMYEHDLIVVWHKVLLAVEVKAAPRVEPFRDVERSYQRIHRAFRGEKGIQKAYEQAARLIKAANSGEAVRLYDAQGALVGELLQKSILEAFAICVTADDFGALATDLSLLLEKNSADKYPWAINADGLEAFFEGLSLKKWGPREFISFLRQRQALHGHATPSDELELCGMFLQHGYLPRPPPGGSLVISPRYSDIFDEIFHEKHGGPAANLETEPNIYLRDESGEIQLVNANLVPQEFGGRTADGLRRAGPNEHCPCGSGRKYKRCCGRNRY